MKKLFLLGACLLALSVNPVKAQTANPDIVVVRIADGPRTTLEIIRGEGKSEEVEVKASNTSRRDLLVGPGEAIQKVLYKLYQEGYTLQSTFSGGINGFTTLILVKAPKP